MHSWHGGGGGGGRLICWQYWEAGVGGKEIDVETLRETEEEVETEGVRATRLLRGDVAVQSVCAPRSAIDMQLCPNSLARSSSSPPPSGL